MALSLNKQDFVNAQLALKDTVTDQPVSATFTDIVLTSSDTAIFTVDTDVNNDAQLDLVGVAAGEATLNVSALAAYTNSNGDPVSETKTTTVAVTVSLPPADGTELVVSFTPPAHV